MEALIKAARSGKIVTVVVALVALGVAYAYVLSLSPEQQEELLSGWRESKES